MNDIENLTISVSVDADKNLKSIHKIVCLPKANGSKQAIDELRIKLV